MLSVLFLKMIVYYFMINLAHTRQPCLYANGRCIHIIILLLLLLYRSQGWIGLSGEGYIISNYMLTQKNIFLQNSHRNIILVS